MLRRLFETAVPVRTGEGRLTLVLFLQSLFSVGAFVAGRSVRDALYLAHGDRSGLAWMYVASAVAVAVVGLLYNPIAARARRDRVALWSALLFATLFAVSFWAERGHTPGFYGALYVYVEVMGALTLVQFWTLANELFNAREAKRLYGLIGAGGTLSNILAGVLTSRIADTFGASAVLLLCAALLLGCAATAFFAGRVGRERLFARAASGRTSSAQRSGGAQFVLRDGHLRGVALLAVVTFFTTTAVDYQFKVIAGAAYPRDQLASYFGSFYAAVGVLALGMQLFGTGALLSRAGVIASLLVLPLSLAGGDLLLVLVPSLWAATLTKGADTLFRYSINDATTQILYLPVPPRARAPAKAFIDGVIKPVSIGLAGLVLLGYQRWLGGEPFRLAWGALGLAAAWCALVVASRARYVRSLKDDLRIRKVDLAAARRSVRDAMALAVLEKALESNDERELLNALELMPELEDLQLDHRVERLLDHPLPSVRIAALGYYARRQTLRFANSVFRRIEDSDPRVRAAAIDTLCAIGRDKAIRSVKSYLDDADPGVRSAAITGMIRFGGLDGVLMAAEALKGLISHPDAAMREHAARILGAIGVRNFYQPVLELMNDSAAPVRREAILAAAKLRSPEFVLPLIYKTRQPDVGHEAVDALAAYGATIAPTLAKVLGNRVEDPAVRRGVARVLGRLGTAEAVQVIANHLEEPDEELRIRLYRSLAKAVRGQRQMAVDRSRVQAALDAELRRAAEALLAAELLGLDPTPKPAGDSSAGAQALLASALAEKAAQTEERLFLLLAVLYPDAGMEQIHAGIRDAAPQDTSRKRANAVELLDNLLERELRRKLLPFFEDAPRKQKLRALGERLPLPELTREQALSRLCADETAWIRACALFYAARGGGALPAEAIVTASNDVSPFVREAALLCAASALPEQAAPLAEARLTDEAPSVRRQAARITGGG